MSLARIPLFVLAVGWTLPTDAGVPCQWFAQAEQTWYGWCRIEPEEFSYDNVLSRSMTIMAEAGVNRVVIVDFSSGRPNQSDPLTPKFHSETRRDQYIAAYRQIASGPPSVARFAQTAAGSVLLFRGADGVVRRKVLRDRDPLVIETAVGRLDIVQVYAWVNPTNEKVLVTLLVAGPWKRAEEAGLELLDDVRRLFPSDDLRLRIQSERWFPHPASNGFDYFAPDAVSAGVPTRSLIPVMNCVWPPARCEVRER